MHANVEEIRVQKAANALIILGFVMGSLIVVMSLTKWIATIAQKDLNLAAQQFVNEELVVQLQEMCLYFIAFLNLAESIQPFVLMIIVSLIGNYCIVSFFLTASYSHKYD